MTKLISSHHLKKTLLVMTFIGVTFFSLLYWWYSRYYVSTDDAYVNANIVHIAPRVTGQVTRLYVQNNQFIKEGQPLFEIDPMPFKIAIDEAKAKLDMDIAQFNIANMTANRTLALVKKKVASVQEGDDTQAKLQSALAAVQLSKARLEKAELDLRYTTVTAPTSGWVTNLTVRVGDATVTNQPLFALISNHEFWIDANFKETDLHIIRPGQKAKLEIDMYPGQHFTGIVESISAGSGAVFSLLPPQNATGNWVKVTQRVPVRVRILNADSKLPLRIGTSATVKIHLS